MAPKVTEEHRDSKRAAILEAARNVFIRQGYQRTTMKDVVEEAGLSRGGVYLYFSSTEEMMLAIIEEADEYNRLELARLYEQEGSVWAALQQLLDQNMQEMERYAQTIVPAVIDFHIVSWRDGKHAEYTADRYQRSLGFLVQLLNKGVEQGEFAPLIPVQTIAQLFISFNDGVYIGALQLGIEESGSREQIQALRHSLKHLLQVHD